MPLRKTPSVAAVESATAAFSQGSGVSIWTADSISVMRFMPAVKADLGSRGFSIFDFRFSIAGEVV